MALGLALEMYRQYGTTRSASSTRKRKAQAAHAIPGRDGGESA